MAWWELFIQNIGGVQLATFGLVCICVFLLCAQAVISSFRGIIALKRKAKLRKKARIQAARRLEFTLPDEHNEYVRERLHTALRKEELLEKDKAGVPVRLRYARQMLTLLKASPLSPIERLDVEEMDKVIALYQEERGLRSEEMKAVNEIFARLLKLSAKYEIAV